MSKRNGDKARANRERKKKMLRRKLNREVRKAMDNNTLGATHTESQGK